MKKKIIALVATAFIAAVAAPVWAIDFTPDHFASAHASAASDNADLYVDEYADEYDDDYADDDLIADPLRGWNMMMHDFNRGVYYIAVKPAADVYRFIVPEDIRVCTSNFFRNLGFPVRFINCLLQGNLSRATDEFEAFFLNTTVGVLGLGEPAPYIMGREVPKETFGQTLAVWGVGNGFYIVLPFLGPSTARNTVGMVGDTFMNPVTYLGLPWEVTAIARATETVNTFSFQKDVYKQLEKVSLDPYVALRNGYIQNDNKNIAE